MPTKPPYLVSDLIRNAALFGEIIDSRDEAITDKHELSSRGLDQLNALLEYAYENGITPHPYEDPDEIVPQYSSFNDEVKFPQYYKKYLEATLAFWLCNYDALVFPEKKIPQLKNYENNVKIKRLINTTPG